MAAPLVTMRVALGDPAGRRLPLPVRQVSFTRLTVDAAPERPVWLGHPGARSLASSDWGDISQYLQRWGSDAPVAADHAQTHGRIYARSIEIALPLDTPLPANFAITPLHLGSSWFRRHEPRILGWAARPELGCPDGLRPNASRRYWDPDWVALAARDASPPGSVPWKPLAQPASWWGRIGESGLFDPLETMPQEAYDDWHRALEAALTEVRADPDLRQRLKIGLRLAGWRARDPSFTIGGCLVLAEALRRLGGPEARLVALGEMGGAASEAPMALEHVVMERAGWYIDAGGVRPGDELVGAAQAEGGFHELLARTFELAEASAHHLFYDPALTERVERRLAQAMRRAPVGA
jgi:hypothetical protein